MTPGASHPGSGTAEALAGWVQEVAPFGIFTTDGDLVIRSWNQWLETHSGLAAGNIIGRPLLEAFPDLRRRNLEERYRRALSGEISILSTALHGYLLPFASVHREAGVPHMLQSARIAPLSLEAGTEGTVTIIEDVTQRECQAQRLLRQQEHDRLLSLASDALLRSDRPLDVMASLFPRLAATLKLDVFLQHVFDPEADELRLHTAFGVAPEARRTLEVLAPANTAARGGEDDPLAARARALRLQTHAGFVLQLNDHLLGTVLFGSYEREALAADELEFLSQISRSASVAVDRAQREAGLEVRVAERTASLNETIAQLESFSYTVAHDLRAPIRSLTNFTEILMTDHAGRLPDEVQDILGRLLRASRRLDALTRDLLSYSRLGSKGLMLERIDVDEVLSDIVAVNPGLQGTTLAVEGPLGSVIAQRTLLQQCLSNLLDNALKFAAPDIPLRILVRSERTGLDRRIWVQDNGIGIDPLAHQKIFDLFERIPGPVAIEGTGIGLAIVARASQRMRGSCGVESAPGEGSRFWLQFPAAD